MNEPSLSVEYKISYGITGHTPASTRGFDIHSFHQNCLSTRLHKGRVGFGSLKGDMLEGSTGGDGEPPKCSGL